MATADIHEEHTAPYREIGALELDPEFVYYQEGRTLRWQCPQCDHDCEHDLRTGWLFGLADTSLDDADAEVIVECACGHAHRDLSARQGEHDGCGCFFKYVGA